MKKRTWRTISRTIAVILVGATIATLAPLSGFADELKRKPAKYDTALQNIVGEEELPVEMLAEETALRNENVKVFRQSDGSYQALVYAIPVHFKDENGVWQDIDNTLELVTKNDKKTYETTNSADKVTLPESFEDGQKATLTHEGYSIAFAPSADNEGVELGKKAEIKNVDELVSEEIQKNTGTVNEALNESADEKALEAFRKAEASEEKLTKSQEIERKNAEKTKLENLSSAVEYQAVWPNTNMEYIITPAGLKENVVIGAPQDEYIYKFNLDIGNLTPVQQADGSILLKNGDKKVFAIQAPYLYDAASVYSDAASQTLEKVGNKWVLTVTADAAWMNAVERVFPVVLDPTVLLNNVNAPISDTYIASGTLADTNYGNESFLRVGYDATRSYRSYLKIAWPLLMPGSVVTDATLTLQKQTNSTTAQSNRYYHLYDATGKAAWNANTLTWENQPFSKTLNGLGSEEIIDYAVFSNTTAAQTYSWNVTKAARNWYEHFINRGMMLASSAETVAYDTKFYAVDSTDAVKRPALTLTFTETNGLREQYDYHTAGAGRAGTAYVNDFSRNLYIERDELGINGNVMPVQIKRYRDTLWANSVSNISLLLDAPYGSLWQINYNQFLFYKPESGGDAARYLYIDSTGKATYYKNAGEPAQGNLKRWVEEASVAAPDSGSELWTPSNFTSTVETAAPDGAKLVDASGQTLRFINGFLTEIQSAVNSEDKITIERDGVKILKIIDGVGREYRFSYQVASGLSRLSAIQCYDAEGDAIQVKNSNGNDVDLKYTYSGTISSNSITFTGATYPDGESVSYDNTDVGFIMRDVDGYELQFLPEGSSIVKITEVVRDSSGNNVPGNFIDITNQNTYQNTFIDSLGNKQVKQFDRYGRTVCVLDGEGDYTSATYPGNENISGSQQNITPLVTTSQDSAINLLKNHGLEQSGSAAPTDWTVFADPTSGYTVTKKNEAVAGVKSYSLKRTTAGTLSLYQNVTNIVAGEQYVLSGWIKVPSSVSGTGAFLATQAWEGSNCLVQKYSQYYTTATGGWIFLKTEPITIPANTTTLRCHLRMNNAVGEFYVDALQLEKCSRVSSSYNYIENADFANGTTAYTPWTGGTIATTMQTNNKNRTAKLDSNVLYLTGVPSSNISAKQIVPIAGKAGDTFRLGAWSKANGAMTTNPAISNVRKWILQVQTPDGERLGFVEYNPFSTSWQYLQTTFTLDKDVENLTLYCSYDYQLGTAYFDGIQLYKESSAVAEDSTVANDSDENSVKTSVTQSNDSHGNSIFERTIAGNLSMLNQSHYTTNGNYLKQTVDAAGNIVDYDYDENTGWLHSVTVGGISEEETGLNLLSDQIEEGENLLPNGGFEELELGNTQIASGWSKYSTTDTNAVYSIKSGSGAHSGNYYQSVKRTTEGNAGVNQNIGDLVSGGTYKLSGWLKIPGTITSSNRGVSLAIQAWNGAACLKENYYTRYTTTNSGWIFLETVMVVPEGAAQLRLHMRMDSSVGEFYVDDMRLELLKNQLGNGGFEQQTAGNTQIASGWNKYSMNDINGIYSIKGGSGARSGNYYQSVKRTIEGNAGVYQNIDDFVPGETYKLSGWLKIPGAITSSTHGVGLMLQAWDNTPASPVALRQNCYARYTTTNGQWIKLETIMTVPEGTTQLRMSMRMDASIGEFYVDDMQLELTQNLLLNPCVEYKGAWGEWSNPTNTHTIVKSTDAHSGSQSYSVSRNSIGTVGIYQNFREIHTGEKYVLSAWLKVPEPIVGQGACVSLQAWHQESGIPEEFLSQVTTTKHTGTDGWIYLETAAFTVPEGATCLRGHMRMDNSSGTFLVDDMSLRRVDDTDTAATSAVTYAYTAMGALSQVQQAVSGLQGGDALQNDYTYVHDRLESIEHNGFAYNFEYDEWGNQTAAKVGTQDLVTYDYDETGYRSLNQITYANGGTIGYDYDEWGNITDIFVNGNTSATYHYTYQDGVLNTITDSVAGTVTTYTDEGLEIKQGSEVIYSRQGESENFRGQNYALSTSPLTDAEKALIASDAQQGLTRTINKTTGTVNYAYTQVDDAFGRTVRQQMDCGTQFSRLTTYVDLAGGRTSNQVASVKNQIGATPIEEYKYSYDNKGNVTRIENGSHVTAYAYDEAGQLISETVDGVTKSFTYDVGGNLVNKGDVEFAYADTWKDQLVSVGNVEIAYDALGNPDKTVNADGQIILLAWSGRQLVKAIKPDGSYETYAYDANGLRTARRLYDADDALTRQHLYTWNDGVLVGQQWQMPGKPTESVYYIYDTNGEAIGFVYKNAGAAPAARWFSKNLQGDITGVYRQNSDLFVTYTYDAWGTPTVISGSDYWQFVWAFGYRGYQYDKETGLYYCQSRYYNSNLGRWINADNPDIAALGANKVLSANLYAYVLNNPVNTRDNNGEFPLNIIIGALVGAVIGAIGYVAVDFIEWLITGVWPKFDGWKLAASMVMGAIDGALTSSNVSALAAKMITFGSTLALSVASGESVMDSIIAAVISTLLTGAGKGAGFGKLNGNKIASAMKRLNKKGKGISYVIKEMKALIKYYIKSNKTLYKRFGKDFLKSSAKGLFWSSTTKLSNWWNSRRWWK
ncbi:MAG: DNRLRE domain-containing protein [Oscillospiraceae bacterium]|nr:DNRLRE domain-containing protein [Oscillospiraceae bacterium]